MSTDQLKKMSISAVPRPVDERIDSHPGISFIASSTGRVMRAVISSTDDVTVESGRRVVVFNIGGNKYRLIAAVHYNTQIVYALLFMTHAEYDKDKWKKVL